MMLLVDAARDVGVVAGAMVAVGGAITLIWTRVVRPMWRIWLETVERTKRLLEIAESELGNGGGVREQVGDLSGRLDDLDQAVEDAIAVNREHMHSSGSLLFDVSNTLADMARQLEQHIEDADLHMRRTVYSTQQRDQVRRMRAQRQQHLDEEGPGADDDRP